jgi:hypothetical protein
MPGKPGLGTNGPASPDPKMPVPKTPDPATRGPDSLRLRRLRRQQIAGILLVAAAILIFTLLRADRHNIFPPGWWHW